MIEIPAVVECFVKYKIKLARRSGLRRGRIEKEYVKMFKRVGMMFFLMIPFILLITFVTVRAEEANTQSDYVGVDDGEDDAEKHLEVGEVFTKTVETKHTINMGETGVIHEKGNDIIFTFRVTKSAKDGEGEVELIRFFEDPENLNRLKKKWKLFKNQKREDYIKFEDDTVHYGGETFRFTAIGRRAFANCKNNYVDVAGKYLERIGDEAFAGCKGKGGVTIRAKKLKEIGNRTFANTTAEVDIEEAKSLEKIGSGAFENAVDVRLTSSIKTIGSDVFKNCKGTLWLTLDGLQEIDDKMFSQCKNLKELFIAGDNIKKITGKPFIHCKKLKELTIRGDKIKSISRGGLAVGSKNYKMVLSIDKIKMLNRDTFAGCRNVTEMDISGFGVKKIGNRTFSDCKKLKEIEFDSKNLNTIGHRIFAGCKKLKRVSVTGLHKLKTVRGDAFKGASSKSRFYATSKKAKALMLKGKGMQIWWESYAVAFSEGKLGPGGQFIKI